MVPVNNTTSPVYDVNIPRTCAGCHADPEYMAEYDIPTDQYQKYARSVHGVALLEEHDTGSPACNDCHGNHGAVPPGATSVANVCSLCHARTSELFSESPHKPAFDARGWPECSQCHNNHDVRETDDSMLGTSAPSVCISCHQDEEDPGYRAAERMKENIVTLADSLKASEEKLDNVKNLGMETAEIELAMREIRQHLIKARALVHTVSVERIEPEIAGGTESASQAVRLANAAVSEYHFRRKGLGISTLIITFVAVMLYLKIRQVERRQSRQE
jgi:predicted CXXCH cytochrome family protein